MCAVAQKMLFRVDKELFATKREAVSYAKTASLVYGLTRFVVWYDGFAVATAYQGKEVGD